jgi:hypothetical protein
MLAATALGQDPTETPTAKPASEPSPEDRNPESGDRHWGGGREELRKRLESLPPKERRKAIENFKRWEQMPPERRRELMERFDMRRQRMKHDIDQALAQLGLQLDDARRREFVARYMDERRKIEEQLRKEMEEKRKPLLDNLMQRLKAEFSTVAASPSRAAQ